MATSLQLARGNLRCEIRPDLGGCIAGLWLGETPVLRSTPAHALDADCADLEVDHCFDGWRGVVHLRDAELHTQVSSSLDRLVVFTQATRDSVAIEPVSHVNNAVNLMARHGFTAQELGMRVLQPAETMSATMSIRVDKR